MKNYARIEDRLVVELFATDGDITAMFESSLVWVEISDVSGISVGWSYADGVFSPPASPASPTHADLVDTALTTARQIRAPIIGILDGMQASALTLDDLAGAQAIEAAKSGLKNITKVDLSGCTTLDEMRLVIKTAYLDIARAVPPSVQSAFSEVLS
jgi:hypothetical protein